MIIIRRVVKSKDFLQLFFFWNNKIKITDTSEVKFNNKSMEV